MNTDEIGAARRQTKFSTKTRRNTKATKKIRKKRLLAAGRSCQESEDCREGNRNGGNWRGGRKEGGDDGEDFDECNLLGLRELG
jgi:hypothetical protein